MVQRSRRVLHHDDEGAAAHAGAVDVAWRDPERLADERRRVLAGGEDAVDVARLQTGVAHGVGDGFQVEREHALPRQHADLVALVHADDTGRVRQRLHRAPPLDVGSQSEIVTSSVSLWNTTCTGMSHLIAAGSATTLTRFDIMRGPSSSSIIAST